MYNCKNKQVDLRLTLARQSDSEGGTSAYLSTLDFKIKNENV